MTIRRFQTILIRIAFVWLLICAAALVASHGEDSKHNNPHRFNGYDWTSWSVDRKLGYIYGLRAGTYLSSYILWEKDLYGNQHLNVLLKQTTDNMIYEIDQAYKTRKLVKIYGELKPILELPIGVVWRLSVEKKL